MEIRLPMDKLSRIQTMLKTWLPRKKATKRQILSLVGTLQHASKVVRPSRTFVSRMYATAAKLCKMHYIHHQVKCSIPFWPVLVAHLPTVMERSEYPAPSCPLHVPRSISPDRCLRNMGPGMCSSSIGSQWC